jgi:hypothetical protein
MQRPDDDILLTAAARRFELAEILPAVGRMTLPAE